MTYYGNEENYKPPGQSSPEIIFFIVRDFLFEDLA